MFKKTIIALGLVAVTGLVTVGCKNDNNGGEDMAGGNPDMTMTGNPDMAEPECYDNPMTHVQIINGCTTAQSVNKMPFYPAKAPNGMLPALP